MDIYCRKYKYKKLEDLNDKKTKNICFFAIIISLLTFPNVYCTDNNSIKAIIDSNIKGMVYGGGKYVAVCDDGMIRSSKELKYWVDSVNTIKKNLKGIVYGNKMFVAYGDDFILLSNDAINWKQSSFNLSKVIRGLAWVIA